MPPSLQKPGVTKPASTGVTIRLDAAGRFDLPAKHTIVSLVHNYAVWVGIRINYEIGPVRGLVSSDGKGRGSCIYFEAGGGMGR